MIVKIDRNWHFEANSPEVLEIQFLLLSSKASLDSAFPHGTFESPTCFASQLINVISEFQAYHYLFHHFVLPIFLDALLWFTRKSLEISDLNASICGKHSGFCKRKRGVLKLVFGEFQFLRRSRRRKLIRILNFAGKVIIRINKLKLLIGFQGPMMIIGKSQ